MTIKHLFPPSKPTLDLNFAAERVLDPRITFTRASIGTYFDAEGVLQTATDDEPRLDYDPATGESLGLLIEDSRTNLVTHSETNTGWTQTAGISYTTGYGTSPDGSTTSIQVTLPDSIGFFKPGGNLTVTVGVDYAFSIYLKADSLSWAAIRTFNSDADDYYYFNLTTGALGTSSTQARHAIESVGNGWYRCSVFATFSIATSGFAIYGSSGDETPAAGSLQVWGAQIEQGRFPTSYIATSGSTATRAAELCSILGTNYTSLFGTTLGSGSIFHDVKVLGEKDNTTRGVFSSFSANDNNLFTSFTNYDNRLNVGIRVPSANIARYYDLTGIKVKSAVSWADLEQPVDDQANASHALDGVLYGGDLYAKNGNVLNTDYDRFGIGRAIRSATVFYSINGHISRLSYYPRRLTDEQLEALTA